MSIISFAQNFEDVMLSRALKHVEKGFYIDVGANDPQVHSVTKAFYDRGWRGINIEPIQEWYERLEAHRPDDINLKIAVGAINGTATLFEVPGTGLSSVRQDYCEEAEKRGYKSVEIKVPVHTLTSICQQHVSSDIHFLKIDVEGSEKLVIEGMDFSNFRPWIMVVESNFPNTVRKNNELWEKLVLQAGYVLAYEDGLNNFYVAQEHSDLLGSFRYPPNVFDNFIPWEQHRYSLIAEQAHARAFEATEREKSSLAQTQQAEVRAEQAEARADQVQISSHQIEQLYLGIIRSRSWRVTAPLRAIVWGSKWILRGGVAWITFKPGSRPRRSLKLLILRLRNWINRRPKTKSLILKLLRNFPRVESRLKQFNSENLFWAQQSYSKNVKLSGIDQSDSNDLIETLSPHAQRIYRLLQTKSSRQEQGDL